MSDNNRKTKNSRKLDFSHTIFLGDIEKKIEKERKKEK